MPSTCFGHTCGHREVRYKGYITKRLNQCTSYIEFITKIAYVFYILVF